MARQTDRQTRSCWWSVTAFAEDIPLLQSSSFPGFVRAVYGGLEACPTTGKEHFQGAVNTAQVRFSKIKDWLPHSHIEAARDKEALKQYVMKEETAVGDKTVQHRRFLTMDAALLDIAKQFVTEDIERNNLRVQGKLDGWSVETEYWQAVEFIISNPERSGDISLYSQPQMYRAWKFTRSVWLLRAEQLFFVEKDGDDESLSENPV